VVLPVPEGADKTKINPFDFIFFLISPIYSVISE